MVLGQEPEILLMTGKVINAKVTSEDSLYIYYDYEKKNGKIKPKKLDWERVFSYTNEAGVEHVVYVTDTTSGNFFSEEEMRYYIKGEQDALNGYRANWTLVTGIPLAGGAGFLLNSSPLVFTVPFIYMIGASLPEVKIAPGSISDPAYLRQPAYILGYERTARTKRLFKSLAAGVTGAAIGVVVGQMTNQ